MKKIVLSSLCLLWVGNCLFAQNSLQQYTPSILVNKGQMELKVFNNLYTQTKVRDENGTVVELGERQSFLNNQIRYLYGLSNEARFNVGLETNLTTAWYGSESSDLMFTSIGPTLKFVPIKNLDNFSVQSTFLFPLNRDDLEKPFINHNRYTWWTQFFYDHSINSKLNLFFEVDLIYRFRADELQDDFFRVPLNLIISYFPTSKLTLYANGQYAGAYGTQLPGGATVDFGRLGWYTQLGLGARYLILNNLELELSYANFVLSKRDGAGSVYNFGIRFLR